MSLEDQFIAPAPWPAAVALLFVMGVMELGFHLARLLCRVRAMKPYEYAASFLITLGAISALTNGLVTIGSLHLLIIVQILGALVCGAGIVGAIRLICHVPRTANRLLMLMYCRTPQLRIVTVLAVVIVGGLLMAALGPATDPDSLHYHLAVPMDWLRHCGAYPRSDWLHARLIGLGEMPNLVGAAMGSDSVGAMVQWAGLIVAVFAVMAFARTRGDLVFAILLVAAVPLVAGYVPTQKPQMIGDAAMAIAMVIFVDRWDSLDRLGMALGFGCVAYAMGCKYSFILTGSVALSVGLVAAYRSGRLKIALLIASIAILVLPGPVWARNLLFYHDPLSPLLERFKSDGQDYAIVFAAWLRRAGGTPTLGALLLLPITITVPLSIHDITVVLGLGTLSVVPAFRARDRKCLPLAGVAAALLVASFSQISPRFFFVPYLWFATAAVGAGPSRFRRWLSLALIAQGTVVAIAVLYGAMILFPGALLPRWRVRTMNAAANGFPESLWFDQIIAPGLAAITDYRPVALFPRPFVVLGFENSGRSRAAEREWLCANIRSFDLKTAVLQYRMDMTQFPALMPCLGRRIAGPLSFTDVARSPFNLQRSVYYEVLDLEAGRRGCGCYGRGPQSR